MNAKIVAIVAVCVAVIAAGISGVVISMQRADAARAAADKAASEETIASKRAREAELERATAAANAREAEAKEKSAATALAAAEAENEKLRLENESDAAKKAIAAEERAIAEAEAQKAADIRKAKEAELKAARENADAERAKAQARGAIGGGAGAVQAAADELARAEATKAIREAETLKLKVSMAELEAAKQQYAELNAELLEYQKELDERERALRPEKTIADLSWLPDEDTEVDESGRARPRKKEPKLPENDPNLPRESRSLAKAERLRGSADALLAKDARERAVAPLERLYVAAVKEGRTVDAAYYRAALKSMYPDWEYAPPEESKEEKK